MATYVSSHQSATFQALNRFTVPAHRFRGSQGRAIEVRSFCGAYHKRGLCTIIAVGRENVVIEDNGRLLHSRHGFGKCGKERVVAAGSLRSDAVTAEGTDSPVISSSISDEESESLQRANPAGAGTDTSLARVSGEGHEVNRPKRIYFDYGFQANFLREGPTVPRNVIRLAFENFGREWRALRRSYLFSEDGEINASNKAGPWAYAGRAAVLVLRGVDKLLQLYDGLPQLSPKLQDLTPEQAELRDALKKLTLSNDAVWEREKKRPPVEAPWWILGPYYILCAMLDIIFNNRPIQRFWFLETVARMPYFSYISMLHLYETLGWWRVGAEVRKVHFAEEWNEMHHLKIMESLGGDLQWGDRFFAQHAAFFYYWILNGMFLISPKVAYNFSELIESHAVDTYGTFVDENEELLKTLPPSPVAIEYYESDDLYMFDEFQTSQLPEARRPKVDSLYDVFAAICGDEGEHVKTMVACQRLDNPVSSPHRPTKFKP